MDNLAIYNAVREVPDDAKKTIQAGKLKGFTDINPMWRIKTLTEQFGACGIGWYPEITKQWTEEKDNIICAFCDINLYICVDGTWSKPIPGTGGSKMASMNKNGLDVSDECYKMAFTDAISVAAKLLGVGASVYWGSDRTKYNNQSAQPANKPADDEEELKLYVDGTKKRMYRLCNKNVDEAAARWDKEIAPDSLDLGRMKWHYESLGKQIMRMEAQNDSPV
jgi:hypothetical protein